MIQQAEIPIKIRGIERGHNFVRPAVIGLLLVLCAAAALVLLTFAESRLSPEQRQQAVETSGVYP